MAAERGYIEIVEYLVVKQADIDIQDNEDKVMCDYSTDQYCIAHLSLNQQHMQVYHYGLEKKCYLSYCQVHRAINILRHIGYSQKNTILDLL